MESSRAADVLRAVVLSGVARPVEIELVCLAICNTCRESRADYSMVVKMKNVHLVSPSRLQRGEASSSRLYSSSGGSASNRADSRILPHRRIYRLAFCVNLPLSQVVWPDGLRALRFGWWFDHRLDSPLPGSLTDLDLGGSFNHHIEEITWPPQLVKLRFGNRFDRQIELAAWPATLQSLTFGSSFDQPIEAVEWPRSLEVLRLGDAFNHPIQSVKWQTATNLKILEFGSAFRRTVADVGWPSGLVELKFGACFNQPMMARELPRSLRLLRLSDMCDAFDPQGMPNGCELRVERTDLFDQPY